MRTFNPEPTTKQLDVYRFLIEHIERHGFQPSQMEIAEALGITRSAVTERLRGLEKRGFIRLPRSDRERAIVLVNLMFTARVVAPDAEA